MNGAVGGVSGPSGPVAGPEYVWDEFNQLYRISDGRLIKQTDPYYDYCMFLMQQQLQQQQQKQQQQQQQQQGFQYNPSGGYVPVHEATIPGIPGHLRNAALQVIERGLQARESDTTIEQRLLGVANNRETSVTSGTVRNSNTTEPSGTVRNSNTTEPSGTVRNSNTTEPTGTAQTPGLIIGSGNVSELGKSGKPGSAQHSASMEGSEMGRQLEESIRTGLSINCSTPSVKSGAIRDSETTARKSEMDSMLVDGRKLVRVETALDFLNSSQGLTQSKVSDADHGDGAVSTQSLSELSRALKTSNNREELDKVIPRFPMSGMSTATVKSLTKRLSKVSQGDVNSARPELFVLSRKQPGRGKKGGKGKAGEEVVGNKNDPGKGYFLFRLHSSNDEANETPTTTTATHTTTTSATFDSSTSSSSDSSSDSSDDDYSDDKKGHKKKKRRKTKKYSTTDDSSDEYDDYYSDTDDYYDYDYYTTYDYDDDDYDYDYDYDDNSGSSSSPLFHRPRMSHIVHSSTSETSVWSPGPKRPTQRRVKRQPKVQRMGEAPLVLPTIQTAPEVCPEYNLSNQNANNYTIGVAGRVSGREASSTAGYVDSQEEVAAGRTPDDVFISCVEEAEATTQRREEWIYIQDGNWVDGPEDASEQSEAQLHYERGIADNPTYDPQNERRMTHDPVYDPREDRRMTHDPVYDPQHDRRMTHDPVYDPQHNRRMTHDPVYDPQHERRMTRDPVYDPHHDRRMTHDPVYDPREDRRMTHDPVYDPREDRRMTHDPVYDPQHDRRMTHDPVYDPQSDRRMTHDPVYDPQSDRRMTHDPVYDPREDRRMNGSSVYETQDDRNPGMIHNPIYDPQDNRGMTHNPVFKNQDNMSHNSNYDPQDDSRITHDPDYDPQDDRSRIQNSVYYPEDWQWQRPDVFDDESSDPRRPETYEQRNQNANGQTESPYEEEAVAIGKEEVAVRMAEEEEAMRMAEEEEAMRMESRIIANESHSIDRIHGRKSSTEFVEIMAKAIAFPDGKYEIVDVDVVPLKPRRSGSTPKVKTSTSRNGRAKRTTRRTPSCKRIPLTSSNAEIAMTQQLPSQLPLAPSQSHPQLHQIPFSANQQTKFTSKINDVTLQPTTNDVDVNKVSDVPKQTAKTDVVIVNKVNDATLQTTIHDIIANRINDVNFQTTLSDVIVNKVNDVLQRTTINDVSVSKVSDVPQRATSATQTVVMTEVDSWSATSLSSDALKVTETAQSSESTSTTQTGAMTRRDSSTQTGTQTNDCLHHRHHHHEVPSAASVPCRSPLYHRHHLNSSSSNCRHTSPIPPPPPLRTPSAPPLAPQRPTCNQVLQTDRTDPDPASSHLVKYGNFVYSLYQQDQLTDVILKAEAECFYAHRSVLACHSRFFASVFTKDPISSSPSAGPLSSRPTPDILEIDDVSPSILRKILEYIYTGQIALHQSFLLDVLVAANKLGLPQLESNCIQKLNALHPQELLDVLISVYNQGMAASDLIDKLWHRIACHFKTVIRTKQFLQMNVDCICRLLLDNDLVLTSEIDVAQAAIRWINEDREQRIPVAGRVLSCIRFKNLTADELVSFGRLEGYILNDPTVKDAILEANWYQTCQLGRTDTGMTSFKSPHIRQKTELRTRGYKAELPTHPFIISYKNWRH